MYRLCDIAIWHNTTCIRKLNYVIVFCIFSFKLLCKFCWLGKCVIFFLCIFNSIAIYVEFLRVLTLQTPNVAPTTPISIELTMNRLYGHPNKINKRLNVFIGLSNDQYKLKENLPLSFSI